MKARAPARAEGRIGKPSSPKACSPPAPGQTNAQPRLFGHSPLCRSISAQTLCPAPQSLSGSGSAGPGLGSRLRVGLTLCWQIGSCPSHGPSITPTQSLWPPPRLQTHLAPSRFRREGSSFKTQDSGGLSPARLGQGPSPQMLLRVPPSASSQSVTFLTFLIVSTALTLSSAEQNLHPLINAFTAHTGA